MPSSDDTRCECKETTHTVITVRTCPFTWAMMGKGKGKQRTSGAPIRDYQVDIHCASWASVRCSGNGMRATRGDVDIWNKSSSRNRLTLHIPHAALQSSVDADTWFAWQSMPAWRGTLSDVGMRTRWVDAHRSIIWFLQIAQLSTTISGWFWVFESIFGIRSYPMPKEILHSTEGLSILGEGEGGSQSIPSLLRIVASHQPFWKTQEHQRPSLPSSRIVQLTDCNNSWACWATGQS